MTDLHPLGRLVEHDPRSLDYPFTTPTATALHEVLWLRYGSVLNQGSLGSCTGNAVAGALNTAPLHKTGSKLLVEKDAVSLYELATTLDNEPGQYPPDDTGSSGLAACKAAQKLGYLTAYTHCFSLTQALQALMHGPVITGVEWEEGFDHPDSTGFVQLGGQVRGGHEFEVIGYDPSAHPDEEGLVWAVNSWGAGWGKSGRFCFTGATWKALLARQGDVTVPTVAA